MIIDQDEKFENVITTLESDYLVQDVFNAFLKMYPEDWKKIKITYSKFKRSKQFGRTIPLSRPEQALQKTIKTWLIKNKKRGAL